MKKSVSKKSKSGSKAKSSTKKKPAKKTTKKKSSSVKKSDANKITKKPTKKNEASVQINSSVQVEQKSANTVQESPPEIVSSPKPVALPKLVSSTQSQSKPATQPIASVVKPVVQPTASVAKPITQPIASVAKPITQPVIQARTKPSSMVDKPITPVTVPGQTLTKQNTSISKPDAQAITLVASQSPTKISAENSNQEEVEAPDEVSTESKVEDESIENLSSENVEAPDETTVDGGAEDESAENSNQEEVEAPNVVQPAPSQIRPAIKEEAVIEVKSISTDNLTAPPKSVAQPKITDQAKPAVSKESSIAGNVVSQTKEEMSAGSEDIYECCPNFDEFAWDRKEIRWKGKLFVKDSVKSIFHIPTNFNSIINKNIKKIRTNGALDSKRIVLVDELSGRKSNIYISVKKPVLGLNDVKLTGNFLSKVFDASDNKSFKNWKSDMDMFVNLNKKVAKKYYFMYPLCSKCSRKQKKNFVVVMAEF